jgi:hypothetical protein
MPCQDKRDRTPWCADYCKRTILTPEQEAILIRIYEMRAMQVNTNLGRGPRNGLPLSKFYGVPVKTNNNSWTKEDHVTANCWKKIVTDKGECFAMLQRNGNNLADIY